MTRSTLTDTLVLGALTGMRSMAGPAILAAGRGGVLPRIAAALAAGEMVADKTERIGDRIDPLPLGGRAAMGALVGGLVAHERQSHLLLGAALGAAAAVVMAHIAWYLRKQAPGTNLLGGLTEDAIVTAAGALYASRRQQ